MRFMLRCYQLLISPLWFIGAMCIVLLIMCISSFFPQASITAREASLPIGTQGSLTQVRGGVGAVDVPRPAQSSKSVMRKQRSQSAADVQWWDCIGNATPCIEAMVQTAVTQSIDNTTQNLSATLEQTNFSFVLIFPESLTTQNSTVEAFRQLSLYIVGIALPVIIVWGGIKMIYAPFVGSNYRKALPLLSRTVLGVIAGICSSLIVGLGIKFVNLFCIGMTMLTLHHLNPGVSLGNDATTSNMIVSQMIHTSFSQSSGINWLLPIGYAFYFLALFTQGMVSTGTMAVLVATAPIAFTAEGALMRLWTMLFSVTVATRVWSVAGINLAFLLMSQAFATDNVVQMSGRNGALAVLTTNQSFIPGTLHWTTAFLSLAVAFYGLNAAVVFNRWFASAGGHLNTVSGVSRLRGGYSPLGTLHSVTGIRVPWMTRVTNGWPTFGWQNPTIQLLPANIGSIPIVGLVGRIPLVGGAVARFPLRNLIRT